MHCIILYYVLLYYIVLYYIIFILCYVLLCYIIYSVLYCNVLVLYCIVTYHIISYHIISYHIIFYTYIYFNPPRNGTAMLFSMHSRAVGQDWVPQRLRCWRPPKLTYLVLRQVDLARRQKTTSASAETPGTPCPNPNRTQLMPLAELLERKPKGGSWVKVVGNGWGKGQLDKGGSCII